MNTYEDFIDIEAPPDRAYEFVSTPANFPQFLPMAKEARFDESGRVQMRAEGHWAEVELHLDPEDRTMHWNSTAKQYGGRLQVTPRDSGCRLNVSIHVPEDDARQIAADRPQGIQTTLRQVLEKVRDICEASSLKAALGADDRGYVG